MAKRPPEKRARVAKDEHSIEPKRPERHSAQRQYFQEALGGHDSEFIWHQIDAVLNEFIRRSPNLAPPPGLVDVDPALRRRRLRVKEDVEVDDADLLVLLGVEQPALIEELFREFRAAPVFAAVGLYELDVRGNLRGAATAEARIRQLEAIRMRPDAEAGRKSRVGGLNSRSTVEEREQRGREVRTFVKEKRSQGHTQRSARKLAEKKFSVSYSTIVRDDEEPADLE
ncbi:MAG: hypothetical protein HY749_20345 [Gammaproteobacteria bacterium]|nr:hypothetical protein [Gammaproteobacteria bacterium]